MVSICRRCLVDGLVQGVFYRASTCQKAIEIGGLAGWVRNCDDGRVEVLVQGAPDKVEDFIDWLWTGSTASNVSSVQCHEEEPGDYPAFSVIR